AARLLQRQHAHGAARQDDVWRRRDQFRRVCALADDISPAPANVDTRIAADSPSRFLQPLQKRRKARLPFRIVRGAIHEHTDAPHALGLLRPRRERPCGRAAEQRDERAAIHSMTSSAIASTPGGMSRPNSLAVLRLITNSNFVGSITG